MESNPFAPPSADISAAPSATANASGAWRDGELLVIARSGAQLPDVCVKDGTPAGERKQQTLYWYPPWTYVFLIFNVLIFAIAALITRKSAPVNFAFGEPARAKRKKGLLTGGGIMLAGVALFFGVAVSEVFIFAGILGLLGGLIWLVIAARIIWPVKMNAEYAWVKGVSPALLGQLPAYNGPPR